MSYLVLARKYRPNRFEEVVGQDAVAKTLKNAVEMDRVAHAYLFAGPRGVGKTSMARILSKALNCEKGPTANPCGTCVSCEAIARGQDMDVQEIDGASNRGIDEVRAVRENAHYQSTGSRHRIYIIDEVHMLTTQAFNALLKILEEPPAHVKFIFATTQPQSIPETIRSRCQRFDFRPIAPAAIVNRLHEICEAEGMTVEMGALQAVAQRARGGMRDAQSLLDQVLSLGKKKVSVDDVRSLLGWVSTEDLQAVLEAGAAGDATGLLGRVGALLDAGQDPAEFLLQLGEFLRDLLVIRSCGAKPPVPMASGVDPGKVGFLAENFSRDELLYMLQLAQETRKRLSRDVEGRVLLEMALLRMAAIKELEPLDKAFARLEETASAMPAAPPARKKETSVRDDAPAEALMGPPSAEPAPAGKGLDEEPAGGGETEWSQFLKAVQKKRRRLSAYIREGRLIEAKPEEWVVGFPQDRAFHKDSVQESDNRSLLEDILEAVVGRRLSLSFVSMEERGGSIIDGVKEEAPARRGKRDTEETPPIVDRAKRLFRGEVVEE